MGKQKKAVKVAACVTNYDRIGKQITWGAPSAGFAWLVSALYYDAAHLISDMICSSALAVQMGGIPVSRGLCDV